MNELPMLELTEAIEPVALASRPLEARGRAFRVRLIRFDRPESKTLQVQADSEGGARAQAERRAGRDWRIARIESV